MLKSITKGNKIPDRKIKDIFDLSGPLSSFSSKSLLCYAFGYISKDVFDDLTKIRKLRNKFAHSTIKVDFISEEIKNHVEDMHCFKKAEKLFKGKRLNIKGSHKKDEKPEELPPEDWEERAMGFIKYTKAAFCLGILILKYKITEHYVDHVKA